MYQKKNKKIRQNLCIDILRNSYIFIFAYISRLSSVYCNIIFVVTYIHK